MALLSAGFSTTLSEMQEIWDLLSDAKPVRLKEVVGFMTTPERRFLQDTTRPPSKNTVPG